MRKLSDYIAEVKPVSMDVLEEVQRRLDNQTKPQGSLGRLEELCRVMAIAQRTPNPKYERKIIFTMAADHGVVEEGVSAYPQSVTAQMVLNFIAGGAGVNVLAKHCGADVVVVDMGVTSRIEAEGYIDRKIDFGTRNFTKGPAMTLEQAEKSVVTGIELALDYDYDLLGTGDMGIGNTTASSAIGAVITGASVEEITGFGTGISEDGWRKKVNVIKRGIEVNKPDRDNPLDVLSKVGGFEIGGIAGLIIGAAIKKRVSVVDGFISTAGALIAASLCPFTKDYMVLSHRSAEKGHSIFYAYLGKEPILDLGLRLGEGTGSAIAMEVIDAAMHLYYEMATFEDAGVDRKVE